MIDGDDDAGQSPSTWLPARTDIAETAVSRHLDAVAENRLRRWRESNARRNQAWVDGVVERIRRASDTEPT